MSHFCVLVIGDFPEEQLARYNENLKLPMHQIASKEDLIRRQREWIESYKNAYYNEFLKDPETYKSNCSNPEHIDYLEKTFSKMLKWTDEECYVHKIERYKKDECYEVHSDGSLWTIYNDNARWDWYSRGGRFRGLLVLKEGAEPLAPLFEAYHFGNDKESFVKRTEELKKERRCDTAYAKDVANIDSLLPFAVVKDGEWHERGEMGWWCMVSNEKIKEEWEAEVKGLLSELREDTILTIYDCHI